MIFEGDRLWAILTAQTEPVQVLNAYGRLETTYQDPRAALRVLSGGNYYGIGQKRRIRFIRPTRVEEGVTPWGANLDFSAPKGARAEIITQNHTSKGAKRWKSRPEKSKNGTTGSTVPLHFGNSRREVE